MPTPTLLRSLSALILICVSSFSYSQCIEFNQIGDAWSNVPKFDGNDARIDIDDQPNSLVRDWFRGSFSMDMWIRCKWDANGDSHYTLMSAGNYSDDHNSFIVFLEKNSSDYRIRVSDGTDSGSNADYIGSPLGYVDNLQFQWVHVAVTFEDETVRVYINGELDGFKSNFRFDDIPTDYFTVGRQSSSSNNNLGFNGHISNYRLWTNKVLSIPEIARVKDRTFQGEETFADQDKPLYEHLAINMYPSGITPSTDRFPRSGPESFPNPNFIDGRAPVLTEYQGFDVGVSRFSPAHPIKPYALTTDSTCGKIKLYWSNGWQIPATAVYRKEAFTSGEAQLLCYTTDTLYIDDDPLLEPGVQYEYTLKGVWKNTEGVLFSLDSESTIASLRSYTQIQNFLVTEDASSGNCDGDIILQWEELDEIYPGEDYRIQWDDGSGWTKLVDVNQSSLSYTFAVPQNLQAEPLLFRIDATGDNCSNYTESISASANEPVNTIPTGVTTAIVGDLIDVSWNFTQSGAPATAFRVYRSIGTGNFEILEQNIGQSVRSFEDLNATMCTDYRYQVEPYNTCGAVNAQSSISNTSTIPLNFDNIFTYQEGGKTESFFDASKGYFNNKILLEWEVNPEKLSDVNTFEIYRRKQGLTYTLLASLDNRNATLFEDETAEANVLYEYLIRTLGNCVDDVTISDSLEALGFRYNTGLVSGKVTFEGGNAVKGVEVTVETDEVSFSKSLGFDGVNDYLVSTELSDENVLSTSLSFDAWVRPKLMETGDRNIIFSAYGGLLYLSMKNMKPFLGLNTNEINSGNESPISSIESDTILTNKVWHHFAFNFDPDKGELELYLNGVLLGESSFDPVPLAGQNSTNPDCHLGYSGNGGQGFYFGHLDEVRIWQTLRTADEIKRDYTRTLTGKEVGLIGYYTMNEGVGNGVYDLSRTASVFNKNDFQKSNAPFWSVRSPSFAQLHPSGLTDENGNYVVAGIQYAGSGNVFNLTPVLGVHEFNPSNISLFIGDNSPVQNGVDFIDISSFRFTGAVHYQNTNFPVEGASVFIDNQLVVSDGLPVLTDQHGEFDINVPIGEHFITIRKDGHEFLNDGQWPIPSVPIFNFQDDVFGIKFTDVTTVKLVGRFVGGDVEGDKKIGLGLSKNNIGIGTITLKNEQDFDIDFSANGTEEAEVDFSTDPFTGEYVVELLPEVYKIESVQNDHYAIDNNDLGLLDLREIPEVANFESDTTFVEVIENSDTTFEQIVNSETYDFKRNFIYYEKPEIVVYGSNEGPFIGEKEVIVSNPATELNDTINLISNSPFLYPVFEMGEGYPIDIRVRSVYLNYDNSADTIIDVVPVEEAEVSITNNLDGVSSAYTFQTDSEGRVVDYTRFRAGIPNMNLDVPNLSSYTKTLSITAQTGVFDVAWNDGNVFRGYVLGSVDAGGASFITTGVDNPEFILRDPPGSNSYAFLEKGSSYTAKREFSSSNGTENIYDNKLKKGFNIKFALPYIGTIFETEILSDLNIGLKKEGLYTETGDYIETYTFNKRFSTSAESNAVGTMADVYIGASQNYFFTETNNLALLPREFVEANNLTALDTSELLNSNAEYILAIRPGFAFSEFGEPTTFAYSHDYVLNELLPSYRQLIFNLMAGPTYQTQVPITDPFYGIANDAAIWRGTDNWLADSLNPSYVYTPLDTSAIDSVAWLNENISKWVQTMAYNEREKADVKNELEVLENISFDGTAGAYSNEFSENTTETNTQEFTQRFRVFSGSKTGISTNGGGIELKTKSTYSFNKSITETDIEETEMNWGYVLDDSEQGDVFSVNVKIHEDDIISANDSEFLNSNNFDDVGYNLGNYDVVLDYAAAGSFALGFLASKWSPVAGQAVGITYAVTTSAIYMGALDHYKDDIKSESSSFGLKGASPIFSLQGGQSRCPYEAPELASFNIDPATNRPVQLHVGTQPHEIPKIEIEPAEIVNVPSNEPAVFTVKLSNESSTGRGVSFKMEQNQNANPNGAVMNIDNWGVEHVIFIPAGETVTKTMTVERGATSNLDFENLQLIFHSLCQFDPDDNFRDIVDTVSFTARFIPSCTNVEFGNVEQNWVANVAVEDTMPINIKGYNVNHPTFERIILQYQQPGNSPTTLQSFYNDTASFNADPSTRKQLIDEEPEIDYEWDLSSLNDGQYTLILKTVCFDGSETEAERLLGVVDRISPQPFGTPQPSDGILSLGEDLSLRFNEAINEGDLASHKDYISVRGIVNGTDLVNQESILHDASLHFDGAAQNMTVANGININDQSFTIEFWAKRERNGAENLVTVGDDFVVGFNSSDQFEATLSGETISTDETFESIQGLWSHYAVVVDRINSSESTMYLVANVGASTNEKVQDIQAQSSLSGALVLGEGFEGNIHELRLWNEARSIVQITPLKSQILTGYEDGLYSLWPLNEAQGNVAGDLAFGRNGVVNATWQVSREGKSMSLDGGSYFEIPSATMAFGSQADFTIEFWYKQSGIDGCLFSSGKGSEYNGWRVNTTLAKEFEIENNGQQILISATDYLDNNWHHFALVVNRRSNVSVLLDGQLIKTVNSVPFGGLGSSKVMLGTGWSFEGGQNQYENFYEGEIDEVRIWNTARTEKLINRYMLHSLTGAEYGLRAYFPFEDVTIEDPSISNESANNFAVDEPLISAGNGELSNGAAFSLETPGIKLKRPELDLPFTFVTNEDELIIVPQLSPAQLENTILTVSVKRVKDLNNNRLASTVSWLAFVDQNEVVWDQSELNIEKVIGVPHQQTVMISNNTGNSESFNISGIPSWLTVTPSSGALNPLESLEITLEIASGLNVGEYNENISLVSSVGFNERLALNVSVLPQAPDWTVDPDQFEFSANVIGQLKIDGALSVDENDKVACFINGEVRGVANVSYFAEADVYLLFMSVYDHVSEGNDMTFKVFDASSGDVFVDVTPELTFKEDQLFGLPSDPIVIEASNKVEQVISLNKGWNWVSLNVTDPSFNDLNEVLKSLNAVSGDVIKYQVGFAQASTQGLWLGDLTSVDNEKMYMVKLSSGQSLIVVGEKVDGTQIPIAVDQGWNWIGYPLQSRLSVTEALSSLNPQNGDIIKSQTLFAVYDNLLGWFGSLTDLEPGEGYLLSTNSIGVINYPQSSTLSKQSSAKVVSSFDVDETPYESNMTMVATIANYDLLQDGDEVYAFVGSEYRGVGIAQLAGEEMRVFITIYGDFESQELNFKHYDVTNDRWVELVEVVAYQANLMLGSITAPFEFNAKYDASSPSESTVQVFPNPFSDELTLTFGTSKDVVKAELFNATGQMMDEVMLQNHQHYEWKMKEGIGAGIYLVKVYQSNGTIEIVQITKSH